MALNATATPRTVIAAYAAASPRTVVATRVAAAPSAAAWGWGGGGATRGAALLEGWSTEQSERQDRKVSPCVSTARARLTHNPLSASFFPIGAGVVPLRGGHQVRRAVEGALKRTRATEDVGEAARPPRAPLVQPTPIDALHAPAFAMDTTEVAQRFEPGHLRLCRLPPLRSNRLTVHVRTTREQFSPAGQTFSLPREVGSFFVHLPASKSLLAGCAYLL